MKYSKIKSTRHFQNRALNKIILYSPLLCLPAIAHSDSVSISGIIDAGVRYDSGAVNGHHTRVESGQMIANRLTFAGEESLGGGLKAGFVLETGFSTDTGMGHANPPGAPANSLTFGRTSAISLGKDQTGYLSFGRQYTPLWAATASPSNDPFAAAWLGGVNTLYNATVRSSNSIAYTYGYGSRALLRPAPAQGLGFAALYSAAEAQTNEPSQSGQQMGFNVSYGARPFWVAYGFHQIKGNNASINAAAAASNSPVIKQQTLATSYEWGNTRFHAGINTGKSNADNPSALNRRNWHVGISSRFGERHMVRALYGRADDRSQANSDFNSFQLGYQYNLSKRSMLYAAYGMVNNSNLSNKTFAGSAGTYLTGSTPKSFITGIRHNF